MSGYFETELGAIHVSDDIVRRVVVPEIDSVPHLDFATRGRSLSRDVVLEFRDGKAVITLCIAVALDAVIFREASELQQNVKRAVEVATGLEVATVNIRVERIFSPAEEKPSPESSPRRNLRTVGGPVNR